VKEPYNTAMDTAYEAVITRRKLSKKKEAKKLRKKLHLTKEEIAFIERWDKM